MITMIFIIDVYPIDCLPMNCLLVGNHEVAINGLSTNTYLDYDCPKFITPTFITSDIHYPLTEIRYSSSWTFTTPFLKTGNHVVQTRPTGTIEGNPRIQIFVPPDPDIQAWPTEISYFQAVVGILSLVPPTPIMVE